ncbi:ImmA/IrrE family metallo-endopeptidase [Arthrobacter castelli]|uniref:ImmA/IrrE family metallo-endopeptidase n=1 Tax=Arthrobacter castelli TaxID=271431 RepID=UPI000684E944|nr:ImmA/IrrE family metallo-endopeptidase [Arthrobacter castelli]
MEEDLSRTAREAFLALSLPPHMTLQGLIDWISSLRGRRIVIVETASLVGKSTCGLWVPKENYDLIYHAETSGPLHRQQMILHELSHMVLGHEGNLQVSGQGVAMFKELSGEIVERALARGDFRTEAEVTAEYLADHLASALRAEEAEIFNYEAFFE